MSRRYLVLGLAAVLALAIAVPVVAAPDRAVAPTVVKVSKRAIAKSRTALRVARAAKRQARAAADLAAAAATAGSQAVPRIQAGLAAEPQTTASESFVSLPGGPSVEVNVPASGLIEVWAQATMDEAGAVSLYQDGSEMPGQSEFCGAPEGGGGLFSGENLGGPGGQFTVGTPASGFFCGTDGAPGPVLFQTTPGAHRYELRYASCGCGGGGPGASPVTFSARRLFVAPRP